MTSEAYASWEIMFWVMRREVLGQIPSFPSLGKHLYLLLPGGVGVNLCSSMWHPFKQLGTVHGRGNQSETHKRVSKNNITHQSHSTRAPLRYLSVLLAWCYLWCPSEGQEGESWSCPVIYTRLLSSCALVFSVEKDAWDKLSTVHTGFSVSESAWVLTRK